MQLDLVASLRVAVRLDAASLWFLWLVLKHFSSAASSCQRSALSTLTYIHTCHVTSRRASEALWGGCISIIRQRFQVWVKPRLAGRSHWAQPRNHPGVIAQRCGGHVTQTAACDWLPLWGDPVRWLQARRRAAPPLKTVMSKLSGGCHPRSRLSVRLSASNLRPPDVYVKIHPSYLYKSWGPTSLHY